MKIHLVMLGKTRRPEIRALLDDYVSRIGRFAEVQLTELREDSAASVRKLSLDSAATVVLLDDAGKSQTSAQFAKWLAEARKASPKRCAAALRKNFLSHRSRSRTSSPAPCSPSSFTVPSRSWPAIPTRNDRRAAISQLTMPPPRISCGPQFRGRGKALRCRTPRTE